ncbi:MAG: hypothetical protein IIW72_01480, partial [Clostridia bacterium]|nr:hypothetical protein [Clostridia bacterium]
MKKRILILSMVLVIVLSVVFTACNKDVYINPVNNEKYILLTDENGGKVLSEDGELLVYVTDEHGKKVKDDNGEYLTEVHGFIGQIEQDGVVEDYAYYFTLPDGWKFVRDTGDFEKKSKKYSLKITIEDETFNDYYSSVGIFAKGLSSASDELEHEYGTKAEWYELDYENVDTKVCL